MLLKVTIVVYLLMDRLVQARVIQWWVMGVIRALCLLLVMKYSK
jgi:hypothetical protein